MEVQEAVKDLQWTTICILLQLSLTMSLIHNWAHIKAQYMKGFIKSRITNRKESWSMMLTELMKNSNTALSCQILKKILTTIIQEECRSKREENQAKNFMKECLKVRRSLTLRCLIYRRKEKKCSIAHSDQRLITNQRSW